MKYTSKDQKDKNKNLIQIKKNLYRILLKAQ